MRGPRGTNSISTASPTTANAKLTMNTASNASGIAARIANATSGPASAPTASSERCTPNERPSIVRWRRERDHRVARRCADALADAVGEQHSGGRHPRRPREQDAEPRVSAEMPYPVAARPLCRDRRSEASPPPIRDQCLHALRDPDEPTELQCRKAQLEREVEGQHGGDHLGGDVGQQAGDAQQDDRRRNPRTRARRVRIPLTSAAVHAGRGTRHLPSDGRPDREQKFRRTPGHG